VCAGGQAHDIRLAAAPAAYRHATHTGMVTGDIELCVAAQCDLGGRDLG
jgi:hypothetical protein